MRLWSGLVFDRMMRYWGICGPDFGYTGFSDFFQGFGKPWKNLTAIQYGGSRRVCKHTCIHLYIFAIYTIIQYWYNIQKDLKNCNYFFLCNLLSMLCYEVKTMKSHCPLVHVCHSLSLHPSLVGNICGLCMHILNWFDTHATSPWDSIL